MSKHVIFNHHEGGFFSNFNKVITHLAHNKNVTKITWNLRGQVYGAFAYNVNEVFSELFEPYDEEISINSEYYIKEFEHIEYTGKNAHNLYLGNSEWRSNLNKVFKKYITPTKLLKKNIEIV